MPGVSELQQRKEQFFHIKLWDLLVVCVGSRSSVSGRISFMKIILAHLL